MSKYWGSVSDDYLLSVELTTDDPEKLENLIRIVPNGPEEPFVEYGYNLKGLEREKMRCAHCNQPHFAGVVVNKAGQRFLVGHICGKHIYGVNFAVLKKDYDAAVLRQDVLRRVREIRTVIDPFLEWLEHLTSSEVFDQYDRLHDQFSKSMPWLWEKLKWHTNNGGGYLGHLKLPSTLFDGFTDPKKGFKELAAEISKTAMLIVGKIEIEKDLGGTLGRLQASLSRIEAIVKQLEEVEQFFQPAALGTVCEWANEHDGKRRYKPGLMSIVCLRDKGPITTRVPSIYKIPDTSPIAAFRAAVSNLSPKAATSSKLSKVAAK